MQNAHPIDLATWPRREQFRFFRDFELPFFNVCTTVEVGPFLANTRAAGDSFFLAVLHAFLTTANAYQPMRLRLHEDGVVDFARIHAAVTVLGDEDVFRFCWLDFDPDYLTFARAARAAMDRAKQAHGALEPHAERFDVIHLSAVPWLTFTSISHPRRLGTRDSVPKIVFGKHHPVGDRTMMPISIELHHGLADGVHVARFLERFQDRLVPPSFPGDPSPEPK